MKDNDFIKTENQTDSHYNLVKNYFRKDAEKKRNFYKFKSEEKVEKEIKKRSMWKIYMLTLDEILKKDTKISSVIDAACGMGNFTMELAKHNNFIKIVGFDFLKETFSLTNENKNIFGNISFLQANLLNLPFKNRSFDFTVCLNTLHHIYEDDFYKTIDELARITKKYLMIEIRNKNYFLIPFKNKIILQKVYRDLPIYCCSVSELNDITEKNKFNLKIMRGNNSLSWASWRLVLVYERK